MWGYDFRNGSTVPPDRGQDIMTYCRTLPWLSDYYFDKVIDHRARLAADTASAGLAAASPASDMLVLWGGMVDGEAVDRSGVPDAGAAARPPDARGPYRVRGTDDDGGTLFSLDFTPREDGHGGRHFFFTVPIEAEWRTRSYALR